MHFYVGRKNWIIQKTQKFQKPKVHNVQDEMEKEVKQEASHICNAGLNSLDRPLQENLGEIVSLLVQILFKKETWRKLFHQCFSSRSKDKKHFQQAD